MSDRIQGYADGLYAVAAAEGNVDGIRAELREFATAMGQHEQLRTSLSNPLLPAATRAQIVDDLLAGKASDATKALVGMVVAAGRGGNLSEIVDAFGNKAAASGGKQVASVRSAVALSPDQQARLATALQQKLGTPVDVQVEIDPSVVGGVITTVGDTVIDGSIRSRMNKMREVL